VDWRKALRYALPAVWTFVPIYVVERLADFYFLTDNTSAFYAISGWRLILFIVFSLIGSAAAGALLKDVWSTAAVEGVSIFAAAAAFNYLCDPRVCFSTGPDGLEPLRLGLFLWAVVISGGAVGVAARHGRVAKSGEALVAFFGFAAVGYYPVIFTFAGARLVGSLYPWDVAAVLVVAAFAVSASVSPSIGSRVGFLLPFSSLLALFGLSAGIAWAYVGTLTWAAGLMFASTALGACAGAGLGPAGRGRSAVSSGATSGLLAVALVLVLFMTVFVVPDAVNGLVSAGGSPTTTFQMGVPVYVGAYMDGPAGHSEGAGVTVDFAGTNSSSIQEDNFLAAGMGIHAAGCCVDGIDYSYRFDVYLFHGGGEALVASAWEVCDENVACGGHSWKVLMFLKMQPLLDANTSQRVDLRVVWGRSPAGSVVTWSYSIAGGGAVNFTDFTAPLAENPDFNTGVLAGGTAAQQNASYFFQFGIMSRYSIGHGGWSVALACPAILNPAWRCVDHASTLNGDQSYWKVFWRWGEDYQAVSVSSTQGQTVLFGYSPSGTRSFASLW
jgi:hypothetical protein